MEVWSIARNYAALLAQPSDSAEYLPYYGRSLTVSRERKVQRKKSCICENCTLGQQYALYSEKSTVRRFAFLHRSLFSLHPLRTCILWCITACQLPDFIYISIFLVREISLYVILTTLSRCRGYVYSVDGRWMTQWCNDTSRGKSKCSD